MNKPRSATQALIQGTDPDIAAKIMVSFSMPVSQFERVERQLEQIKKENPKVSRSKLYRSFIEDSLSYLESR